MSIPNDPSSIHHEGSSSNLRSDEQPSSGGRYLSTRAGQLLELAVVFSPVLLILLIARIFRPENPLVLMSAVWFANLAMLVLIGLGIKIRGDSWKSIGLPMGRFRWTSLGKNLLTSVPILVFALAAFVVGAILAAIVFGIPGQADMSNYNYLSGNLPMYLLSLAGVYVVSSFGEEVVYRGFLMTRLGALFGTDSRRATFTAIVLSSLIFGFAHLEWGPAGIIQTTCMGAALAVSFLLTKRNLWPLVLAHGYMDTVLLTQLFLATDPAN